MANRKNTFLLKRSNIAGKVPAAGDLQLGELALNTADNILYASGTTANSILPIGWDRVARTGDTMTGTLFAPSISATTISADSITLKNYIDFNTGTTIPSNVSGRVYYDNQSHALAYYPDINQNVKVEMGQQLYIRGFNNTGSIILKGSVLSIQSATNGLPNFTLAVNTHSGFSQVIGLAASDIPINGNGLALSQGILSGITINSFNVGDILYASPFSAGTYVASTDTFPFTARTNQVGFVIATGTTTGEIYVSINNEDENLTLTDIERNILEGNVISTGTYEYTGATTASSTTINVAPMKGWIVRNTYTYATSPDVTNIYYTGGTNISITNIGSADSTYLLVNSASTLYQQITFPTPQQRRENIFLGKVLHPNRSTIQNINNTIDFDVSPMSAIRDLWTPLKLINQGVVVSANGSNLNINTSAGILWGNGIGWYTNQLNPDSVTISGTSPTTFQYRTQTGGTFSNTTSIDPNNYDNGGVITAIGGGSNSSTNQRIYLFPTGVVRVQYGQHVYTNLAEAVAGAQTESFVEYVNNRDNGILIGILSLTKGISVLNNISNAVFNLTSKFGEVLGGTGGISTTTLQQAYNNSTNPEITTNLTLGGVQFRSGTGTDTNPNIIIENNAGNATGQWLANGGLSATTISATTYYGLPTDIRVTGGTYSSTTGTATFTNNTGGTFSVTGFKTNDIFVTGATYSNNTFTYTNNTGGTFNVLFNTMTGLTVNGNLSVTGNTNVKSLTATTISSTTNTIYSNLTVGSLSDTNGLSRIYLKDSTRATIDFTSGINNLVIGTNSSTNANFIGGQQGKLTIYTSNPLENIYISPATTDGLISAIVASSDGVTNYVGINNENPTTTLDVNGSTKISSGLSAATISATTYLNLPTDIRVTGATYSANTFTYKNNTGGTFNVLFNTMTGLTVNGNLTATTISATTYQNLPTDVRVTGGTYSNTTGAATFTNNTGGTFSVTGFTTGFTASNYVAQGRLNADQTITPNGDVVIQFIDDFDPQNWWDASTYRLTPTIAGYYIIDFGVWWPSFTASTGQCNIQARKNGNTFMILQTPLHTTNANSVAGTKVVYLNGSTDYVDFTAYHNNGVSVGIQSGGASGQGTWYSANLLAGGTTTSGGGSSSFTGGTITGPTNFTAGLTANTISTPSISATTYLNLPTDITITGSTYSNNTFTFTNNTGGTFNVLFNTVTGLTSSGTISSSVISATTYSNLPTDVRVTGSTYSNNTFTFTNNTGGTFNVLFNTVTGLTSSGTISTSVLSATTYQNLPTDIRVTGGTYSSGTATFTNNTGGTFTVSGFSTSTATAFTGGTVSGATYFTGGVSANTLTASGTGQNILTVVGSGNSTTSPIFSVVGSQGELFSVTDSLTGSLFSVNDISGLPIVEVFSDNTTLMGSYQAPSLNTTVKVTLTAGTNTVYSIPTSAYTGAFFDYTVISTGTTGARAGTIMSIWSGTTAQSTDVSTNDIGTTAGISFSVAVVGGNVVLSSSATTTGWTLKTIVRSI